MYTYFKALNTDIVFNVLYIYIYFILFYIMYYIHIVKRFRAHCGFYAIENKLFIIYYYTYMHACMHTYIHTYTCTYIHRYPNACMHAFTYINIGRSMWAHAHWHTCMRNDV